VSTPPGLALQLSPIRLHQLPVQIHQARGKELPLLLPPHPTWRKQCPPAPLQRRCCSRCCPRLMRLRAAPAERQAETHPVIVVERAHDRLVCWQDQRGARRENTALVLQPTCPRAGHKDAASTRSASKETAAAAWRFSRRGETIRPRFSSARARCQGPGPTVKCVEACTQNRRNVCVVWPLLIVRQVGSDQ
jgi:hypothetical protein